jgi:hypothetical protein
MKYTATCAAQSSPMKNAPTEADAKRIDKVAMCCEFEQEFDALQVYLMR